MSETVKLIACTFLLTPLREGRLLSSCYSIIWSKISTHAPAGGATSVVMVMILCVSSFLLTPLREGRLSAPVVAIIAAIDFYSRPCGRGDQASHSRSLGWYQNFYSRPCGRGDGSELVTQEAMFTFLLTPLREGRL